MTLPGLLRRLLGRRTDSFDPFNPRCWAEWRRELGVGDEVGPGDRPRHVYFARPDLREAFPLGLTPHDVRSYATWLAVRGRADVGVTDAEINGFVADVLADPGRGLAETYLVTPGWQREVRDGLTGIGWPKLITWLRGQNELGRWSRRALPRREIAVPSPYGVNVLGHFRYASGLREETVQFVNAAKRLGSPVVCRNLPFSATDSDDPKAYLDPEAHGVSLIKVAAYSDLDELYRTAGIHPRKDVYRVACWSWELELLPEEPVKRATLADEFWAPSEFGAAAVRTVVKDRPVFAVQPSVRLDPAEPVSRPAFGLPEDRFLFYFAFDAGSQVERKNPFGLVRAYRKAFRPDDRVHLAIKVSRSASDPAARARLYDEARAGGVTIIDSVLPRETAFGLMGACDAYVSLHRSEGFGFTTAEAMALGKPTIATAYSANLDYMTPANSFLVNYRLSEIVNPKWPYPSGAVWADPDEAQAAELMRRVYDDRDGARAVAERGRAFVHDFLSVNAFATRLGERLAAIRSRRTVRP
jgi:glycosyltransferase involved in cell wall biosynthesis